MELLKIIKERRSIRRYKDRPVPEEVLMEILEAARWAPSWANTQTWNAVIVKDTGIKKALKETLGPHNPARNAIEEAPIVICLFAKQGVAGFSKGNAATNKGDWFMFDAGIAMEPIVLAGWNFGLGTVHVGSFDAEKAEGILGIPEGFSMVEITPLGYFDEVPKAPPRIPLAEKLFLDTYGTPYPKG